VHYSSFIADPSLQGTYAEKSQIDDFKKGNPLECPSPIENKSRVRRMSSSLAMGTLTRSDSQYEELELGSAI
jgi:hypothetical protein